MVVVWTESWNQIVNSHKFMGIFGLFQPIFLGNLPSSINFGEFHITGSWWVWFSSLHVISCMPIESGFTVVGYLVWNRSRAVFGICSIHCHSCSLWWLKVKCFRWNVKFTFFCLLSSLNKVIIIVQGSIIKLSFWPQFQSQKFCIGFLKTRI